MTVRFSSNIHSNKRQAKSEARTPLSRFVMGQNSTNHKNLEKNIFRKDSKYFESPRKIGIYKKGLRNKNDLNNPSFWTIDSVVPDFGSSNLNGNEETKLSDSNTFGNSEDDDFSTFREDFSLKWNTSSYDKNQYFSQLNRTNSFPGGISSNLLSRVSNLGVKDELKESIYPPFGEMKGKMRNTKERKSFIFKNIDPAIDISREDDGSSAFHFVRNHYAPLEIAHSATMGLNW
mmetsp:Transcript_17159/g.25404  ORF Transcript_17159/g.25404 Transcript_17159/m.25404 type:complete len:232 (-) Transcript_17159:21-716(-)